MKKQFWLLALLIIVLSACSLNTQTRKTSNIKATSSSSGVDNKLTENGIKTFANAEELRQFMSQSHGASGGREMLAFDSVSPTNGAMAKNLSAPVAEGLGGGTNNQAVKYSETNNQVSGVDEPDIVKTNGHLLFYARNNKVEIIRSFPASESKLLKTLTFDGYVNNLFIYNNKLVVYGAPNNFVPKATSTSSVGSTEAGVTSSVPEINRKIASMPIWQNNSYTFLKIYNLDQPENPTLLTDLTFEGSAVDARLINSNIYLITNKYTYGQADGDITPRLYRSGTEIVEKSFPLIRYFDLPYQNYSFTSINALDLNQVDAAPSREILLLSGNENIFATAENLYISYTEYLNEQDLMIKKTREILFDRLSQKDQELIGQIDSLDPAILNDAEKLNKIYSIIMRYSSSLTEEEQKQIGEQVKDGIKADHPQLKDELVTTHIQKLNLVGAKATYQAQAKVPGRMLNQFSMDEYEGNLRIATTRDQSWSQILDSNQLDADNAVYVLDKDLNRLGELDNLAPKERIYSARFINDRAYLVTFVQTDPLFVIDLKNPSAPSLLGELKMPGYSNYLHPINETVLLGIGKDTKVSEWGGVIPSSLKLALFDVSDPTSPKILDEKTLGGQGSDSAALYDHKAFLFDKDSQTIILPASLMKNTNDRFNYDIEFNGSLVYKISDSKLQDVGRIEHSKTGETNGNFDYTKAIRRNLIIENNIYSISQDQLKINQLNDLKEVGKIFFSTDMEPQPYRTLQTDKPLPLKTKGLETPTATEESTIQPLK